MEAKTPSRRGLRPESVLRFGETQSTPLAVRRKDRWRETAASDRPLPACRSRPARRHLRGHASLLETMEMTTHAKAKPFEIGGGPQEGSHGNAESQGLMAHQHEQHRLQSADRPLAEGTRSSRDEGYLDQTALRGQVTACLRSLMGTAGCGPACPVVWEG